MDGQGIHLLGWEPHRSLQALLAHLWLQQPTDGLGSSPVPDLGSAGVEAGLLQPF